ncbi:MAG: N-acetylmuramoyl-L-alanine amidase [Clostridia bacterium]|nr:N-acetylmuramoyl-L-alanine amidase [Clostridia bacterium]
MRKVFICTLCTVILLTGCGFSVTTDKTEPVGRTKVHNDTETTEKTPEEITGLENKVIVIDAGHCIFSQSRQEEIAPGSGVTKPAFVSGTSGANQTEEQLNLSVALRLQAVLEKMGAKVYMTRTTHESDMSNIDRAQFANELNADISVKIHADGSGNTSISGVSVLVPGTKYIRDNALIDKSRKAGEFVLNEIVSATGANNRGISVRDDMTGFNWSTVPVILVEMGFMTNPQEDKLMETSEYQDKIVMGIVNGLKMYFE